MKALYVLLALAGVVLLVVWYQNRNVAPAGGGYVVPHAPSSGSGLLDSLTATVTKIQALFDSVTGRSTVPPTLHTEMTV